MTASNPVIEFLSMNGTRLPLVLVYIVGIVFASATWRRHPRASLLSLIAFVIFLVDALLSGAFTWLVLRGGLFEGGNFEQRGMILNVGNGFFTLLNVVAWILLLIALFGRRPQEPAWNRDNSDRPHRPFAEPAAPPRRSGPPSEEIQK